MGSWSGRICRGRDSNPHEPYGSGAFKAPASTIPPPRPKSIVPSSRGTGSTGRRFVAAPAPTAMGTFLVPARMPSFNGPVREILVRREANRAAETAAGGHPHGSGTAASIPPAWDFRRVPLATGTRHRPNRGWYRSRCGLRVSTSSNPRRGRAAHATSIGAGRHAAPQRAPGRWKAHSPTLSSPEDDLPHAARGSTCGPQLFAGCA